jgi:hypothetical protein
VITGHVARRAHGAALDAAGDDSAKATVFADSRRREPVVRVWPGSGLRRITASRADPLGQLSQLVAAPLPDGCEWHRVPGEVQRDLIGSSGAVVAAHGLH